MLKIPSLRLLCLNKFPIKDVLKDRNQLQHLLSYPSDVILDIFFKMDLLHKDKSETFIAVDSQLTFYFVYKRADIICDEEEEFVIKQGFYYWKSYLCIHEERGNCREGRHNSISMPSLKDFVMRCSYIYCIFCEFKLSQRNAALESQRNAALECQKMVLNILKKKIEKYNTPKSLTKVILKDKEVFLLTPHFVKKLSEKTEEFSRNYFKNSDETNRTRLSIDEK